MHPKADSGKIGSGTLDFPVCIPVFGTQCFWVTRTDGTTEKFSYKVCVKVDWNLRRADFFYSAVELQLQRSGPPIGAQLPPGRANTR